MNMELEHLKERLAYLEIQIKTAGPNAIVTIPCQELKSLFEFAIAAIGRKQIVDAGFSWLITPEPKTALMDAIFCL